MQITVGMGITTVLVTVSDDGKIVRVETPYVNDPTDPLHRPYSITFDGGSTMDNLNQIVAFLLYLAGLGPQP